jgi:hypothetical protein
VSNNNQESIEMQKHDKKFAVIPVNVVAFLVASRASVAELAVVTVIYSFASKKNRKPFPSLATISKLSELDRRRVSDAVTALRRDELLLVGKRIIAAGPHAGLEVNDYDLPALEKLADEKPEGIKRSKRRRRDRDMRRFATRESAANEATNELPEEYVPSQMEVFLGRLVQAIVALPKPYLAEAVIDALKSNPSLSDIPRKKLEDNVEVAIEQAVLTREFQGDRFLVTGQQNLLHPEQFRPLAERALQRVANGG